MDIDLERSERVRGWDVGWDDEGRLVEGYVG